MKLILLQLTNKFEVSSGAKYSLLLKKNAKPKPSNKQEHTWDKFVCEFSYYLKEATLLKVCGETILYWTVTGHKYLYIKVI